MVVGTLPLIPNISCEEIRGDELNEMISRVNVSLRIDGYKYTPDRFQFLYGPIPNSVPLPAVKSTLYTVA